MGNTLRRIIDSELLKKNSIIAVGVVGFIILLLAAVSHPSILLLATHGRPSLYERKLAIEHELSDKVDGRALSAFWWNETTLKVAIEPFSDRYEMDAYASSLCRMLHKRGVFQTGTKVHLVDANVLGQKGKFSRIGYANCDKLAKADMAGR